MPEIVPDLTEDEAACLMILKDGAGLLDMGGYSRWSKPVKSLVVRGFAKPRKIATFDPANNTAQAFDYVITDAGRSVCEAWENQSLMDVIRANNSVAERKPIDTGGFTEKQIRALADFYWKMTGRNPSEICPP